MRWLTDGFDKLRNWYVPRALLPAVLANRPWPLLIGVRHLCVLRVALVPLGIVGEEYIPPEDRGEHVRAGRSIRPASAQPR